MEVSALAERTLRSQPSGEGTEIPEVDASPLGSVPPPELAAFSEAIAYQIDVWERSILFLDTLRQRANNMIEHERAGLPPLLNFKYEVLLDARLFERPANYALLRITDVGDLCWQDCVDPAKPPVIVIDPRAGHGPGIGGFKRESEVGIALHVGHPVYFVSFFPAPCPHQTLEDVLAALTTFAQVVAERHNGRRPVLYGNCQAGWAATLLSAHCSGVARAVVMNGSPLSYWAGEPGMNPMRLAGGLLGGTWLAHFTADLAGGRFDGAWLAQNFESLQPERAIWDKYSNLFAHVDSERERFLEFERWWNGFYQLSGEEIVAIVENLFVGNRLEEGRVRIDSHCTADLRSISNPLVIFASYGDNITPPHQALGWVPTVYRDTDDLVAAGQRIVYLTNQHVGHLGIFVSAAVARLEHRAILENLDEIERLQPGLYELKIDNPTGDPECARDQYTVRFEPRRVEDLHFDYQRQAFERVRRFSELNELAYQTWIAPWARVLATPWATEFAKWSHPMRMSRLIFSDQIVPGMALVGQMAQAIAQGRHRLSDDHPLVQWERTMANDVGEAWGAARRVRDAVQERTFQILYGN